MLARRLNGKYLTPDAEHLKARVKEIYDGNFKDAMEAYMNKSDAEIRERYNNRDIEA